MIDSELAASILCTPSCSAWHTSRFCSLRAPTSLCFSTFVVTEDDLRVADLGKSSASATVVSTSAREKAAEEVTTQLEAFRYRCAGTLDGWIRIPPYSEVFFRPEEVDRRSEPFDSSTSLLCSFSDPYHDASRFALWGLWRYREV